ncbi:MAG: pilus assembly protein [Brachymonas sp.]|nr:pilus assembly protein [Brachymonas sp.]NJS35540.1 pilus assembly protein [Brachymonas sp.]
MFNTGNAWIDRAQAAAAHLGLSLAVSALAAALVFFIWYPYPYREISGGRELFFLVVAVDVVLGPLLTFAIFNRAKPWKTLQRDLAVIVVLQVAALFYGLWTVAVARPVHLVFEYHRFRPIHAIELETSQLAKAPAEMRNPPWTGPTLIGLRSPQEQEKLETVMAAAAGVHEALQPQLWQPYTQSRAQVIKEGKQISELRKRFAQQGALIDKAVAQSGRTESQLLWLPMYGRKDFWTAIVDAQTAQPLAYLPLDSF